MNTLIAGHQCTMAAQTALPSRACNLLLNQSDMLQMVSAPELYSQNYLLFGSVLPFFPPYELVRDTHCFLLLRSYSATQQETAPAKHQNQPRQQSSTTIISP